VAVSLQQLRYFVAVAEERQITAAARRLHMALRRSTRPSPTCATTATAAW
jgi:hypothetical protein